MDSFNKTVDNIQNGLTRELPGLDAQIKMSPSFRGENRFNSSPTSTTRNSAILISLFPKNGLAYTVLIKRTTYNGVHSGQVSFPGGKQDDSDTSIVHTALREAQEEVGIEPDSIHVIGELTPLFIPVSNLMVHPVVGIMPAPKQFYPNLHEVEYTIVTDLLHFKKTENLSVKTLCVNNIPISAPYYAVGNDMVWGATAMIISELTELY